MHRLIRSFSFGLAVIALIGVAGGIVLWRLAQPQVAPPVSFNLIDGRQLSLAEQRGKTTIVTFWATTCTVCMEEMPDWEELYQDRQAQGLQLIAVAMPYDRADWVLHFAKHWTFPVALDPMGELTQAFGDVELTPSTFIISPAGEITQQLVGRVDFDALRAQLDPWL